VEQRDYTSLVITPVDTSASKVRRLTMITSLSSFSMQLGYNTNSLDLFWPSAPALPQPTLRSEALAHREAPPQRGYALIWNTRRDPLSATAVREALTLAADREALITTALHGHGRPQVSLFAPGLWLSGQPSATKVDLTRAESLLGEAGWLRNAQGAASNSRGSLMFTLLAATEDGASQRLATELRFQWAKLGVQVVVKVLPRAAVMQAMQDGAFDGVVIEKPLLSSWDLWNEWHTDEPGNVTGTSDRQLDLLLEALRHEFIPEEAAKRAQRAEAIILGRHAILPLVTENEVSVMRESLSNTAEDKHPWTLGDLFFQRPATK
jgi:ABC-type transport system substrate-binding protein